MSRTPRIKSESGIYHVMLRGINRQKIFSNDIDKQRFIEILKKYDIKCGFELYAFCIMNNHVHLLIKESEAFQIDGIIKRVAGSYVYWYNQQYSRIGHLFQDRFRSEPVNDDQYFLTVLRYIHQNPVKAGICNDLSDYKWSSFVDYKAKNKSFVDTEFALEIVSYDELMDFIAMPNEDVCLEDEQKIGKITFEQETQIFKKISGVDNCREFSSLSMSLKKEIIYKCRELGVTEGGLTKLTGLSRYLLNKI